MKPAATNTNLNHIILFDHSKLGPGYGKISMGLKPSGNLHLGTAATVYIASLAASRSGARLDIQIMDLDFDYQRGNFFLPYRYYEDPGKCHGSMREHVKSELEQMLDDVSAFLGGKLEAKVTYFSESSVTQSFIDTVMLLYKEQKLKPLLPGSRQSQDSLFSPVCECKRSNTCLPKVDAEKQTVSGMCMFDGCSTVKYTVRAGDDAKLNFHYMLDPIRDAISDANGLKADLHVFGGDYLMCYGQSHASKVDRISRVVETTGHRMSYFVGPTITVYGEKLSKSEDNGMTITSLRGLYHGYWIERLDHLLSSNLGRQTIDVRGCEYI
ncbi:hypothetical protein HYU11_05505 [Candidatus Woesearchaeota archaeon]|nr:hypothetical protein [Candidatus Woesearchaeota archaeon]